MKVSGFTKSSCSDVQMDLESNTLKMECFVPEVKMEFEYNINGKILLLPVYGTGPGSIILDRVKYTLSFTLEEYEKKGKKHFKVVDNKFVMDPELIRFNLENLFDGDKTLGDNINTVINENWQEIFADVRSSYQEALGQIFAEGFQKCDRKQNDFDDCLTKAIDVSVKQLKKPIKEYGLPNLEPLEIPSLTIGAGTGPVAVQQNYKNMKLSGFTSSVCSKIVMDFEKKKMTLPCVFPQFKMDFDYELNGKILLMPISGRGPGSFVLDDLKYDISFDFEEYEKKGAKHYKVVSSKLVMEPKRLTIKLENLFDGNAALGANINKVMNENWQEIFADVKASYEEAFAQITASIFNNLLAKVPIADIFGNE
ncbi:JHBP domain containing protein [Asbolus verrucosus]|uniref:JHBP domain containing protein n=1 Tax=Asbolus verrucosus TaxID=1661398 RepID=A0A482VEK8_ASBVE|nr:JHBP domain containing protein [Asbolus verrucosus]